MNVGMLAYPLDICSFMRIDVLFLMNILILLILFVSFLRSSLLENSAVSWWAAEKILI